MSEPLFIFIAGASASGKSKFAELLAARLNSSTPEIKTEIVTQDKYYKKRKKIAVPEAESQEQPLPNFDIPAAFDLKLLQEHLYALNDGIDIEMPQFCFEIKDRLETTVLVKANGLKVVILEGILALEDYEKYKLKNKMAIFIDQNDYRLLMRRRVPRDIESRDTSGSVTLYREKQQVGPAFFAHISSSRRKATFVVDNNFDPGKHDIATYPDLHVGVEEVLDMIREKLGLEVEVNNNLEAFAM